MAAEGLKWAAALNMNREQLRAYILCHGHEIKEPAPPFMDGGPEAGKIDWVALAVTGRNSVGAEFPTGREVQANGVEDMTGITVPEPEGGGGVDAAAEAKRVADDRAQADIQAKAAADAAKAQAEEAKKRAEEIALQEQREATARIEAETRGREEAARRVAEDARVQAEAARARAEADRLQAESTERINAALRAQAAELDRLNRDREARKRPPVQAAAAAPEPAVIIEASPPSHPAAPLAGVWTIKGEFPLILAKNIPPLQ